VKVGEQVRGTFFSLLSFRREGSCLAEHSRERHKAVNGNEEQILEKFETF
jgi:hypothetical protein